MYKIDIDLKGLSELYSDMHPDMGMLEQGIVSATQYLRDVWTSAVQGSILPGMTMAVNDDVYAKSLATGESMKFPSFLYGVVMPVGYDDGADRIEDGFSSFDMKPGLLNGPNSRVTKDGQGRYNVVPFRHFTPNASSSISVKMKMPDNVYGAAKQLDRNVPDVDGMIKWGGALEWNAQPVTSWNGYVNQASYYDGMFRIGSQKQTQYLTFRRVSSERTIKTKNGFKQVGSDPNSWIHPGVAPNHVVQAVYDYCMPIIEKNLFDIAEKAFGIK